MNVVRSDHEIQMRNFLEKFLAAALRHAAHDPEHHPRAFPFETAQNSEFPDGFALRLIPDAARIQDNDVGFVFFMDNIVSGFRQHCRGRFAVAFIHLASVCLDIDIHLITMLLRWMISSSAS